MFCRATRFQRRTLFAAAGFTTFAAIMSAAAAEGVSLFKIVTPKDEMFVGLTNADIAHLGTGSAVEQLSKKIAADGQMTIWQYGVKHDADGKLVFGPIGKVSVFAAGVVRIEPYKAAYDVLAPAP
jgi:hypothetical protein